MNTIHTSAFTFHLPLQHRDLPGFRGAISALAGREKDLFHNHDNRSQTDRNYHQRYPLVQYRIHGGKASLFGVNEGARAIEKLLLEQQFGRFRMNGRRLPLALDSYRHEPEFRPQVTPPHQTQRYRMFRYLPFSPEKYREYKSTFALQDKVILLETLLRNHIVAFAHAVNWVLPEDCPIEVTLNDIERVKKVRVKERYLMAFDLVFSVNAVLPEGLGLGRKVAYGFGATVPVSRLS